MLYSFSHAMAAGTLSPPDAVACCADAGADAVEPAAGLPEASDDDLIAMLAERGLGVACFDASADLVADTAQAEAVASLASQIRRGAALGAPIILIVPGSLPSGTSFETGCARAADGIRALLPLAAELGVVLTVEQMGGERSLCRRGPHLRAMLDALASPHFGLTYDAGNSYITREDPVGPLRDLLPWVRHVHFKDITLDPDGSWTSVALGQGDVPLAEVYRILADGGYDGYVSVEYEGPDDPCTAVRAGITYLRHVIGSGGAPPARAGTGENAAP
jgi:sugar phosphate isomerase/epimerase